MPANLPILTWGFVTLEAPAADPAADLAGRDPAADPQIPMTPRHTASGEPLGPARNSEAFIENLQEAAGAAEKIPELAFAARLQKCDEESPAGTPGLTPLSGSATAPPSLTAPSPAPMAPRHTASGEPLGPARNSEAFIEDLQGAAEAAEKMPELAFAARLQQCGEESPAGTPGLPPLSGPATAQPQIRAGSGMGKLASVEPTPDTAPNPGVRAEQGDASQLALGAVKNSPPVRDEPRGNGERLGQTNAGNGPAPATPLALAADREIPTETTSPARETARPAEEPVMPPVQPASHDVSLRLADGQKSVDIRMAERAGEIRVTVHTPDHDLADSLRNDLPDLVGKLRQSGFQAETWRPAAPAQAEGNRRSGAEGFTGSSQQHSAGARKDGRQPQKQSQDQSRWAGEWKLSRGPAQESTT